MGAAENGHARKHGKVFKNGLDTYAQTLVCCTLCVVNCVCCVCVCVCVCCFLFGDKAPSPYCFRVGNASWHPKADCSASYSLVREGADCRLQLHWHRPEGLGRRSAPAECPNPIFQEPDNNVRSNSTRTHSHGRNALRHLLSKF